MKRKTAREILAESFRELARSKSVDKITVPNIIVRPESNERKLFLKLTPDGEALKQKALPVPDAMRRCLRMPDEELLLMKELLNKALHSMEMR